jgi:membrane protease YdiL (CAAX protease family)
MARYPELVAVVVVGVLHVATEILASASAAGLLNAMVSVLFLGYLRWRVKRDRSALQAWGMWTDNFWPALRAQLVFGAVGAVALLAFGAGTGGVALPATFWLTVGLYPIWGIAQQFALQSLIARNLREVISRPVPLAFVATALFAVAHYPRIELVILTGIGGVFFTLIYRRMPNLWAVGIVHGILGSLAVYIVLKVDPGAAIWTLVAGQ